MKKRLVGMRNLKTALSVLICMVLTGILRLGAELIDSGTAKEIYSFLFVRDTALYSCIATVVSLQTTIGLTVKTGVARILGTLFGGVFAIIILYINSFFHSETASLILIFIGVIMVISFCNLIGQGFYSGAAVLMFLIVVFSSSEMSPYVAALHRLIDTAGGVAVAFAVNRLVFPPK